MAYRRRLKPSTATMPADEEEEINPSELAASSPTYYLWPFPLFHPCNVLSKTDCHWNSGSYAPAFILLDLGTEPICITRIELLTEMLPATGRVQHQIRIGLTPDTLHNVCVYSGVVNHSEWIQIQLGMHGYTRRRSRYIEIRTHESPSWVAWRRIRVWKACQQ
jgi:hypothetical protein